MIFLIIFIACFYITGELDLTVGYCSVVKDLCRAKVWSID